MLPVFLTKWFFCETGEEMVIFELIPENEDQKLPKNSVLHNLHNFSKIITNESEAPQC